MPQASAVEIVGESVLADCKSVPDEAGHSHHECMPTERRCVYCGSTLAPYQCHGCGRFLSAAEMHNDETRCSDCI